MSSLSITQWCISREVPRILVGFCVVSIEHRHSGSLDSSLIRWSTMPTFRWYPVGHMIGRYAHIEQIAILWVQFVWHIVLIKTQKRLSKHRKLSSGNSEFRLRCDRTAGLKQTHDGIDPPPPINLQWSIILSYYTVAWLSETCIK